MANSVRRLKSNRKRKNAGKNLLKKMSNKVKRMSNRVKNMNKNLSRRRNRNRNRNRNKNRSSRRNKRRTMRGGRLEFAPLPCDADGNTDFQSSKQVGHETCVEYGTDGAEKDARAGKLEITGELSDRDLLDTIESKVDTTLRDIAAKMLERGLNTAQVRNELQGLSNDVRGASRGVRGNVTPERNVQAAAEAARVAAIQAQRQAETDALAAQEAAEAAEAAKRAADAAGNT